MRVLLLILLLACVFHDARAVDVKTDPIPPIKFTCDMVEMAAQRVRDRVGDEMFDRYIQFSSMYVTDWRGAETLTATRVDPPEAAPEPREQVEYDAYPEAYVTTYWLWEVGGENGYSFQVDIDLDGNLLGNPADLRIPECAAHPEKHSNLVSAEKAMEIAREAGKLETSVRVEAIGWDDETKRLVWSVQGYQVHASTKELWFALIDAFSGETLYSAPRTLESGARFPYPRSFYEWPDSIPPLRLGCRALLAPGELVAATIGQERCEGQIHFTGLSVYDARGGLHWEGRKPEGNFPPIWIRTYWEWGIPGLSRINFSLQTDENGNPIDTPGSMPLPDCAAHPELCNPTVTWKRAHEIAETARMPEMVSSGISGLTLKNGRLVWSLEFDDDNSVHSQKISIDAVSGEIIESEYRP